MKAAARRTGDVRRQRRARFLKEAGEVFAEHGFRETTMEMLADKLGVAKVILYRHFASKEDLIHCILESIADKLVALDAEPEESPAIRAVETLVLARREEAAFVLLVRHARNDPLFGYHYKRVHTAIAERLTAKMLGASIEPVMSRMSAEAIADICINGALNWLTYGSADRDQDYSDWLDKGIHSICITWRERF